MIDPYKAGNGHQFHGSISEEIEGISKQPYFYETIANQQRSLLSFKSLNSQ